MSNFSDMFSLYGSQPHIDNFGEDVVYYPRSGGQRTIKAKVYRSPMQFINETGELPSQELIVTVKNSDCDGISSTEIDTGGDELGVALRQGSELQRRSIARVIKDHNGMVKFMVQ